MASSYENTLEIVRGMMLREEAISEAWKTVVEHISDEAGTETTSKLRGLDIATDLCRLEKWITDVFSTAPPPRKIRGLRFGLFHPESEGRPSCDLYLAGASWFDHQSHTWAYDQSYLAPTTPQSLVLDQLYLVSVEDRFDGRAAIVHLCLWYGLLAVAELCRRHSTLLRGTAARRGVGVGFDGGDIIVVGAHSKAGFSAAPLGESKHRTKRRRLPPGEYFKLEGGRESLLCDCNDGSLPRDLFRRFAPSAPIPLIATVSPDWLNQSGTFGSLSPFSCHFIQAEVATQIEREFPGDVQFLPLNIVGRSEEWRAFNVLHCVRCFDREESNRLCRVILRNEVISGHNIFCVAGYYEGLVVFVSRPVAQFLIDQGVTGIEFVPVIAK